MKMGPILNVPAVLKQQQTRYSSKRRRIDRDGDQQLNGQQNGYRSYRELSIREFVTWSSSMDSGCSVCGGSDGAFLECSDSECNARFHALCGWFNGYKMTMTADESGHLLKRSFCAKHSRFGHGEMERDLKRFGIRRARGLTENVETAQIHRRERVLDLMTEHLQKGNEIGNRFDLYLPERCAVCFGDEMEIDGDFEMKQCTNCRIWVHRGCYLEVNAR